MHGYLSSCQREREKLTWWNDLHGSSPHVDLAGIDGVILQKQPFICAQISVSVYKSFLLKAEKFPLQ